MNMKVVVITGASSGIGRALAYEYAGQGYALSLAARNIDALHAMLPLPGTDAGHVLCTRTDVAIENDCRHLINATIEKFGRIDILINNAGISMRALFRDVNLEVMRRLMDVNFWGTVYCTYHALPWLLESKGSVTGVISVAGHIGLPGRTGYSASKYAVRGFLDALRTENLKTGLHVLVVAPGFTATNIRSAALTADGSAQGSTPRDEGRMMTAEEVARRISKAVAQRKNSLVLTFAEGKLTVFLHKLFPGLVSRMAYNHMAKEPDSPFK